NDKSHGITGHTDMLYVYNVNTGLTTYDLQPDTLSSSLPPGMIPTTPQVAYSLPANTAISSIVQTPALTIPSVGAYVRGNPTVAHTWCPTGTAGSYDSMIFYPASGDSFDVQSDVLAATTDGNHILGATVTSGKLTLSDIAVDISPTVCTLSGPLSTNGTLLTPTPLAVSA